MQKDLLLAFGQTVRKLRLSKDISQENFADMCDLHRTYISDVELGKRNVSLENIRKIATALNMHVSELFQEVERNASI
ncbi:helix-turn-helix domain-containing protein [Beduinella massiliensis]|uniref:helix-turn-helix domain-containing protein n=1 Tax=Beduinella massiliensis TaxID=1852363 RepID=UPI000C8183D4